MKTYPSFALGLSILLFGLIVSPAALVVTNQPTGFRLTIELQDGSKIVGKAGDDDMLFRSDILGDIKLPIERIRSIECPRKTNSVQLTTIKGDTLTAQFVTKVIHVETAFGKLKLPVDLVQHMQVSPLGKLGQNRLGLVALWLGDGNGVDSIGGHNAAVPPDVT